MNQNATVQAVEAEPSRSSASKATRPSLSINVSTSRICGLVYFVDTITARPHTTSALREWYLTQKSEDVKLDKQICETYSRCLDDAGNKYDAPDSTGRVMTLSQRIACMATECNTLDELFNRLTPNLPAEILTVITATYKHFEPIYEACVWKPRYDRLIEQVEDFRTGITRIEFLAKLDRVRKFMRANWPEKTPFETTIIPVPDEPRSSHADSVGKCQIVEIVGFHGFNDQSDTLFHELCHSLWGQTDQEKIRKQFARIGGATAYFELNEALATALGQGWFCHVTYPAEEPREIWYGRDITENFGRGLYPLVTAYLDDRRSFDTAFIRQAVQIFRERCPRVEMDVAHTLGVHVTSEDAVDYNKLQNVMFAAMPIIRQIDWSRLASTNLAKRAETTSAQERQIVLLSSRAVEGLTKHGLSAAQVEILRKSGAGSVSINVNQTDIVFCMGPDVRSQEGVFSEMLKNGYPTPVR